jgi:hypothetical protein
MAVCYCQWRCTNAAVGLVRLGKDVTESDVFHFFLICSSNFVFKTSYMGDASEGECVTPTNAIVFFL